MVVQGQVKLVILLCETGDCELAALFHPRPAFLVIDHQNKSVGHLGVTIHACSRVQPRQRG